MINKYNDCYNKALEARNNAYAPYSNFFVGAAVKLKNDMIITGCNIENASYGLSNCAERTALFKVYEAGYKKEDILYLLVVANTDKPVFPCGACRQVMAELMPKNSKVIMTNLKEDILEKTVEQLLPYSFSGEDLDV